MNINPLTSLSYAKYERLLPRIFDDAAHFAIRSTDGEFEWSFPDQEEQEGPTVAWAEYGHGLWRRRHRSSQTQFRAAIRTPEHGDLGWLMVSFDTGQSTPLGTAELPLQRAFADATIVLQDELALATECNQLAEELTERYEELNLVYSTKDQIEYFEEGQDALLRLVGNCAEYLNVGVAVLVCRDRKMLMQHVNPNVAPPDVDNLIEILSTDVYDSLEAYTGSLVINDDSPNERDGLLRGRCENLLAHAIVNDQGATIGILAVAARGDLHVFSNGDKNLLEVMAKKAARIIYTHHDPLTGLMNRNGFESSLVSSLAGAKAGGLEHSLLYLDIDQLHVVNDLLGEQEGNSLISRVAKTLRSGLRETDYLARLGGDEFGIMLANCDTRKAANIAEKIRATIAGMSVVSASRQLAITASIGVAAVNTESDGIVSIMAAAEIACKAAKDAGRNRIEVFEEDNTTLIRRSEEVEWIGRIHEALREDKFELHCQPVLPLDAANNSDHFEVLVRMLDANGEIQPPSLFLPAAERYQLMPLVDRWVIKRTLQSIGEFWSNVRDLNSVFCMNLSGQSFASAGFLKFVRDEITQAPICPSRICFEVTETAAIANIDEALDFTRALKKIGCKFSLDDFGAGLSSFGYLKVLPVDYLKIDGSFVKEATTDNVSRSMVRAICQIAKTMRLKIVAEYVGDNATVDLLRDIGVDYVQGYHIGKPERFTNILARTQRKVVSG